MQVRGRDPLRGRGNRPQRRQHPTGDHPTKHARDQRHDCQRDHRTDQQVVQVDRTLVGERACDLGQDRASATGTEVRFRGGANANALKNSYRIASTAAPQIRNSTL